jgi:hypothetical protein
VYFARCTGSDTLPIFYPRRTGADSTRRFFTDWAWACVGGVPTGTIAPGASVTVSVPFGSIDQPNMQPPLKPEDMIGEFRVVFLLCNAPVSDSDRCAAAPVQTEQSNAFSVHY